MNFSAPKCDDKHKKMFKHYIIIVKPINSLLHSDSEIHTSSKQLVDRSAMQNLK